MTSDQDRNGTIGRFRLLGVLGRGSSGTIHWAEDLETGERVAIKLARADRDEDGGGPGATEVLEREAELLSRLRHPNVVRLKRSAAEEGSAYLVLEHLEGLDLETSLLAAGKPLEEAALRPLLRSLAEALVHIHEVGVLHRDLKPGNIGRRRGGEPVIVDFGAAARQDRPSVDSGRWSDVTAGYAAPEQYLVGGAEGPWTDIYGLGAIAYRAIAGVAPPAAPDRQAGETMAPAAEAGEGRYSAALLRAVDWALELDPEARPQSAVAWAQALEDADGETRMPDDQPRSGAESRAPDPSYPPTERVERIAGQVPAPVSRAPVAVVKAKKAGLSGPRPWVWIALIVVWGGVASAGWLGWPLYERHYKTTWIVDAAGGGDTLTIGEALAKAADEATILVRPGTYAESLSLDRPVYLKAAPDTGGEAPLLAPPEGPCIIIRATAGAVVGLRLRSAAPAENTPPTAEPCIDIAASDVLVEGNEIESLSGPAIRLRNGAAPTVRANRITGSGGPGILFATGARGAIVENTIEDIGGSGMIVRGGAAPDITGNLIADSGSAGVLFAEAAGGRFEKNTVKSSAASGIEIGSSADPIVAGNRIESAGQAGIFVYDLGRGRFRDNEVISSSYSGLVIAAGGAPDFEANLIRDSAEHGILAIGRGAGVIDGNAVLENKGHGIALARDTDIELGENALESNKEPQVFDGWLTGF